MFVIYLISTAIIFALCEIQIEGRNGWAKKLPTWKIPIRKIPLAKYFFRPERPLTGYHTYTWILIFLLTHSGFLIHPWSLKDELLLLAFYTFLITLEDFIWFIINPHFGLKKFSKNYIPWHQWWFLGVPTFYWVGTALGLAFYIYSSQL